MREIVINMTIALIIQLDMSHRILTIMQNLYDKGRNSQMGL